MQKIIIDTDIGYDIDDTWALSLMLSTNLFDVKLISVTQGDIDYQVALVAKILKLLGKEHIPIARGICRNELETNRPQLSWLADFDLSSYAGKIYSTYEEAYENILSTNTDVVVVGLAPFTSLAKTIPILKKYNLTDDEIDFIESMIKPME